MGFAILIVENLLRQRTRTALTVVGIAVGIATVVALGVLTSGFSRTADAILGRAGADVMVVQRGAADMTFSAVPSDRVGALAARPDVARAVGVLLHVSRVGGQPYFPLSGVAVRDLPLVVDDLIAGRLPAADGAREAVIGSAAARSLGLRPGATLVVGGTPLAVVGTYRSDDAFDDAGAYAPLGVVQAIAGRPDAVSAIYVVARAGVEPAALAASIERADADLATIRSVAEYGKVDQGFEILDAVQLAISLLAIGIGAVGVTNTMVMSVFERTREIGVLRAVGWSRRRVLASILGEGLALCLLAAVVGLLLGTLAGRAVTGLPQIGGLVEPAYDPAIYVRALGLGLAVGLLGALYPALRATRLTPMEALRHE